MSNQNSKKSNKGPDQFQAELIKGFQWTTAHSKMVLGGIAVFVVLGVGYSIYSVIQSNKETKVQEQYYTLEKNYSDKKAAFDQAKAPVKSPEVKTPAVAASGDLQKDYGTVIEGFEKLIQETPRSLGAQMSALHLSEIYMDYKKPEEALRVLNAVESGLGKSEMLASLVYNQYGAIYANQKDCAQAITQWQKIVDRKKLSFAHDEAKLRMALCYESLNDLEKAEQLYSEVSRRDETEGNLSATRDAEKYLRLLKMKKNLTGSGT